jgi:hypothetical protein
MAAPTNAAKREKALANPEPSTHGTKRTSRDVRSVVAIGGKADMKRKRNPVAKAPDIGHGSYAAQISCVRDVRFP